MEYCSKTKQMRVLMYFQMCFLDHKRASINLAVPLSKLELITVCKDLVSTVKAWQRVVQPRSVYKTTVPASCPVRDCK